MDQTLSKDASSYKKANFQPFGSLEMIILKQRVEQGCGQIISYIIACS